MDLSFELCLELLYFVGILFRVYAVYCTYAHVHVFHFYINRN